MPASDLTLVSQWSENDADYTAYNAAVAAAKAKQGEENYDKMYTAETRDALAGALAIDVAGKKFSEQSVVDAATKAINDAVAALEVMTYNAIFTVDGAQYEAFPRRLASRSSLRRIPLRKAMSSRDGIRKSARWALRISPSPPSSKRRPALPTPSRFTRWMSTATTAQLRQRPLRHHRRQVTADTTAAEGFTFDESAANVVSGTVTATAARTEGLLCP